MILLFFIFYWVVINDTTPFVSIDTLALFPIGVGLHRGHMAAIQVARWFRFRRYYDVLFRPIGTYWWTRLVSKVLARSPFLLGVFTLGRIVRIVASGGTILSLAILMVLLEYASAETYGWIMSMIPLLPMLDSVIGSISPAVSIVIDSANHSISLWKLAVWTAVFLWTHFFSIPCQIMADCGSWFYDGCYYYVTGMYHFIRCTHYEILMAGNDITVIVTDYDSGTLVQQLQPGPPLTYRDYTYYMYHELKDIHVQMINEGWRSNVYHYYSDLNPELVTQIDKIVVEKPYYLPMVTVLGTVIATSAISYLIPLIGTTLVYMSS